jgi:hypothetical protein
MLAKLLPKVSDGWRARVSERASSAPTTTPCMACLHVSSVVDEQWVWLGQVVGMHGVSGTSQQATLNISDAKSFRLWNKDPACPPIHVKLIRDIHSVSLSLSLSLPLSLILHVLLQIKNLDGSLRIREMSTFFWSMISFILENVISKWIHTFIITTVILIILSLVHY